MSLKSKRFNPTLEMKIEIRTPLIIKQYYKRPQRNVKIEKELVSYDNFKFSLNDYNKILQDKISEDIHENTDIQYLSDQDNMKNIYFDLTLTKSIEVAKNQAIFLRFQLNKYKELSDVKENIELKLKKTDEHLKQMEREYQFLSKDYFKILSNDIKLLKKMKSSFYHRKQFEVCLILQEKILLIENEIRQLNQGEGVNNP